MIRRASLQTPNPQEGQHAGHQTLSHAALGNSSSCEQWG